MKRTRSCQIVVVLLGMSITMSTLAQVEGETFKPSIWGIEVPVTNVDRAVTFYTEALGFSIVQSAGANQRVVLDNDGLKLIFHRVEKTSPRNNAAGLNLNLRVADLDETALAVRAAGGTIESNEPITAAIGIFIPTLDPFGNSVHLIDLTGEENDPEGLPRLYNVGFTTLEMEQTEAFYVKLGFEVYSRAYLPDTLPLKPVGAAMLVLHPLARKKVNQNRPGAALLLACKNLKSVANVLKQQRVKFQASENDGPSLALHDPSGNRIRIMDPSSIQAAKSSESAVTLAKRPIDAETAAALFERFKSLEGQWMAKSTKGWNDRQIFEVIGNLSVVMQTSVFKDDPESTMITMYHLDGDRLMLTHYCAARNQPRMVATSLDAEGRVTFTYLDGTNLPSRDSGHMDSAEFHFIDDDHFTDRWTWYADGKADWMEEVTNERMK